MGVLGALRGVRVGACVVIGLILLLATPASARITAAGTVTLFAVPKPPPPVSFVSTQYIAAGPDGNLWFTEGAAFEPNVGGVIGRITPHGRVTEFQVGYPFEIDGITAGADGNLWYSEHQSGIARISLKGAHTEFEVGGIPWGITAGPDGNIWFAAGLRQVGRITPTGAVTEFSTGISSLPFGITAGPDGNLWFTEPGGDRIGRITPTGTVTEFPTGLTGGTFQITTGPDGNLWFTEYSGSGIGRMTPAGTVTEFSTGITGSPLGIAAGPDGNVWFTENGTHAIGRITPSGSVTEFAEGINADQITAGPDGNLWFTTGGEQIGRISVGDVTRSVRASGDAAVGGHTTANPASTGPRRRRAGPRFMARSSPADYKARAGAAMA
jgi:streptogramin lyase